MGRQDDGSDVFGQGGLLGLAVRVGVGDAHRAVFGCGDGLQLFSGTRLSAGLEGGHLPQDAARPPLHFGQVLVIVAGRVRLRSLRCRVNPVRRFLSQAAGLLGDPGQPGGLVNEPFPLGFVAFAPSGILRPLRFLPRSFGPFPGFAGPVLKPLLVTRPSRLKQVVVAGPGSPGSVVERVMGRSPGATAAGVEWIGRT